MAEQEACTSAVTEALAAAGESTDGADGSETRGESLLLPLLQGLLGSGGDKLLAGLGAAPADVVADVRRSLSRLRAALAPPTAHPQARALLTLADRLEDALDAADRLDGCRRKPRRRSRAARHTVGVTHEELEEARRLVDRNQLELGPEPAEPPSSSVSTTGTESVTPERKPSVEEVSYHNAVASRQKHAPVAHSVSYEPPKVNRDAQVVERRAPAPRKPEYFRHSVADAGRAQPELTPRYERRPSDTKSSIAAIANKFDSNAQTRVEPIRRVPVEPMRRVPAEPVRQAPAEPVRRAPVEPPSPPVQRQGSREEQKRATLYMPLPPTYNFAAPPTTHDDTKPLSRFSNNKKLRMKRANTIDIGRPFGGYRVDSDEEEKRVPAVPEFRPQTENDRKFVAFMRKNEETERNTSAQAGQVAQANWSSRFGNIKNAFESREHGTRSASTSAARNFWKANDSGASASLRPRKFFAEPNPEIVKPPWVTERREPARVYLPRQEQPPPAAAVPAPSHVHPPMHQAHQPPQVTHPPQVPHLPQITQPPPVTQPPQVPHVPQAPQAPSRDFVKPFVARPIPVNQFSHAPMSAFKPPTKITSPTAAPPLIWSPPSTNAAPSPAAETTPAFPVAPKPIVASPPAFPIVPKPIVAKTSAPASRILPTNLDSERPIAPPYRPPASEAPVQHAPPTLAAPQAQNYPVSSIPSQNELSAPELVRRIDDAKYQEPPKVDAQRLQIEFYERQIRERNRREPEQAPAERKPPTYTVTDFTPPGGVSTFLPLQRTPDIEKARAHKVDYLPDVVTNETDRLRPHPSPPASRAPPSPRAVNQIKSPHAHQNGDALYTNGVDDDVTTEHGSVVTRVMRGPVRGAATITAGVRTRGDDLRRPAADSLRTALDKFSSPKNDVLAQIERKKRDAAKQQLRAPLTNGLAPVHAAHSPLGASRESVVSSSSAASGGSAPLSRSDSWHQMPAGPKSASPRRVVARAKSMHLLAIPKLYEGGIARDDIIEKKRTVEAYFSGQAQQTQQTPQTPQTAPQPVQARASPSRARAGRAAAAYSLGRSRTMPAVSELQFLDESNADDAFEDLVSALA